MYVSPYSKNSNPKRNQGPSAAQNGATSDVNYQTADERHNGFNAQNVSLSNNNLSGIVAQA